MCRLSIVKAIHICQEIVDKSTDILYNEEVDSSTKEGEEMVSRYEQFAALISGIERGIQKIERDEMEKLGYKGAYAQYLVAMKRYPEGLTAAQLCEICDKDKAAISRVLTEMQEKGLILREPQSDHRYNALIKLTAEGLKAAAYVDERAQAAIEAVGNEMTDENRAAFYATLDFIAAKLQTISKEGLPPKK